MQKKKKKSKFGDVFHVIYPISFHVQILHLRLNFQWQWNIAWFYSTFSFFFFEVGWWGEFKAASFYGMSEGTTDKKTAVLALPIVQAWGSKDPYETNHLGGGTHLSRSTQHSWTHQSHRQSVSHSGTCSHSAGSCLPHWLLPRNACGWPHGWPWGPCPFHSIAAAQRKGGRNHSITHSQRGSPPTPTPPGPRAFHNKESPLLISVADMIQE